MTNQHKLIENFVDFINILKRGNTKKYYSFIIDYAKSEENFEFVANINSEEFIKCRNEYAEKFSLISYVNNDKKASNVLESVLYNYIQLLENETNPDNICFNVFKEVSLEYHIYTIFRSKNYFIVKKAYETFTNYFQTGNYHIYEVTSVEIFKYLYKHLKNRIDNENTCPLTKSSLYHSHDENPNFLIFQDSIKVDPSLREYMWEHFPNHINYKHALVTAICNQGYYLFDFWKVKCLTMDLSDEENYEPYSIWAYTQEELYGVCYTYGISPNFDIIDEIIEHYPEYLKFIPFRRIIRDDNFEPTFLLMLEKYNVFNLEQKTFSWRFLVECATNILRQCNENEFDQFTYREHTLNKVIEKLKSDITSKINQSYNPYSIYKNPIFNKNLEKTYECIINKLKMIKIHIENDPLYWTYIENKTQYQNCEYCDKNNTYCKYTSHAFYDSHIIHKLSKILPGL